MISREPIADRRIDRTHSAIFAAFRTLVHTVRYDEIRVQDIIEEANVGRSTFYAHFQSKDDVLLTSIEPLFAVIADTVSGKQREEDLAFVLEHFWEQRSFARIIFSGPLYFKLSDKLADMIAERSSSSLSSIGTAAEILGILKAWLAGRVPSNVGEIAAHLTALNRR
ncbi:MAG: TetR family transcriptional regulator [Pseudomonadota bacterium]